MGGESNGEDEWAAALKLGDALRSHSGSGCSRHSKSGRIECKDEDVDESSGTSVLGGANEGGANDRADDNWGRDNAACSSLDRGS